MAEYLIKGETLTSIADNIRSLTGATDSLTTMDMSDEIINARIEVDSQALLIERIAAALEGKAGGRSAETCTVTFDNESISSDCAMYAIIATVLEDGERKTYVNFASDLVSSVNNLGITFTIPNAVCGTKIYMIAHIYNYAENGAYVEITGSATYDSSRSIVNSYDRALFEFTAPSVADEHCTIYYSHNA